MIGDFELFKQRVYQKTGIDLNSYKERQMYRRLETLVKAHQCRSFLEYFDLIERDGSKMKEFLDRITINVSEFFRNPNRWEVLEKKILPKILSETPQAKIWSAACSSGEEPYTVAMILAETAPCHREKIWATDIDAKILAKAKEGVYNDRAVVSVPPLYLNKYFTKGPDGFRVIPEIKSRVAFQHHDLLKGNFPPNFDLIICRNVMIYFTEEAKDFLYREFHKALRPGGVLFVGSTEQILSAQKIGFKAIDTFFYEKV